MMNQQYQQESLGRTGIQILCDEKEKHRWKEDKMSQLKKETENQVEDTTKKYY